MKVHVKSPTFPGTIDTGNWLRLIEDWGGGGSKNKKDKGHLAIFPAA